MTGPRPLPRRSLQARLALSYAAGVFGAGIVVLAIVTLPLVGIQSTTPVHSTAPGTLTGTGRGIDPHQLLVGSAVAIGALIPIALAAGWFIAGRFLRPLRAMAATASAISAGNLQQRLDLGEPTDELTELGHILDGLLARLQSSFDAQRHFVANASHELRTPLAGLHTLLEVTLADPDADADSLRSTCQEALALCGHQERLVQALLALATSERGLTRKDTLDLAHVAREVLASRRDQAAQADIGLAEHLTPAVTAGDPKLIESLVANLVDNAIRHNHPDGHVLITTQTHATQAALTITNSGPVIPDDQIQRLFQPFQKLAPGRHHHHNGFGLGLAIVKAIAQAHDATLTTTARPKGGLTITVRFTHPPSPAPSPPTERLPSVLGDPA
ncbi:HAMP domain-containing sensor histidine kinase [Streptomyces sp. ZAF1911]|uniref:sensor histidine kinase n=1 Tax=Streptomyces sp. ZAF1911 TaxID=2944129 RepID=UPI00237A3C12|nr:HAMP domain-containing sensor histidine kinase [Streptomyces sp. ZAF1911]MDD9381111.1 HAMP domain-containing sensor histidine kinase [Streptomyces sp. ZAF1911]